jgi:hypothetical protein
MFSKRLNANCPVVVFIVLSLVWPAGAREFYVASSGDNGNAGTLESPLQTIQAAANQMRAGDSCVIRGGTYRETVIFSRGGSAEKPIRFRAYPGEVVILKGTDIVDGTWQRYKSKIYKTQLKPGLDIGQVFVDNQPMTLARWPNASFKDRWGDMKWQPTGKDSTLGNLVDPELARMDIDWTGAVVTLNTKPSWDKWTATVENHAKGKDNFDYTKALQWKQFKGEKKAGLGSYYLSGKLEALDVPQEWFYDKQTGQLYLYLPQGDAAETHVVEVKTRNYGFYAEKCDYIILEGLHFFGTTFNFRQCDHCTVDRCHIRFPNVAHHLTDLNMPSKPTVCTQMIGHHNTVRNSSLAYSPTQGLRMLGSYNLVENNLIFDINWVGSLCYCNIWMGSLEDNYSWEGALKYEGLLEETVAQATAEELENVKWGGSTGNIVKAHDPDKAQPAGKCAVRGNTLFANGNVVLGFFEQPDYDISYNHVYDGGYFCRDVSSIYTTLPQIRGSVVHHNWVKTAHKLCIRADDQSRSVTLHHNVMWGSKTGSLVVKGDDNAVYHNTSLSPKSKSHWGLNVQVWAEPDKPHYRKLWPLLPEQNANTPVWNNLSHKITDHHNGRVYPADDRRLSHNLIIENPDSMLVDPAGLDFRPKQGSALIDAAKPIKGINDDFVGKAPDIGAYEYGGKYWLPGYRNFVRTFEKTVSKSGKQGYVKIALAMPPLTEKTVKVSARDQHLEIIGDGKVIFTPANWNVARTINFKILQDTAKTDAIDFELEQPYESGPKHN